MNNPSVKHMEDRLGVHMTLLTGHKGALLFDTGYGVEDTASRIRAITSLPLTVVLSHGHHDHAMGCLWFDHVFLHEDDLDTYRTYTGRPWRSSVLLTAKSRGVSVSEENFLSMNVAEAYPLDFQSVDLGGLTVHFFPSPGHTPGSIMAYVPEEKLLLTGDDWNPVTWCFFPEAMSAQTLLASLRAALALPFENVLCPHSGEIYHRLDILAFLDFCTEDRLLHATPTELGRRFDVDTRMLETPEGYQFHFDFRKAFPQ